MLPVPPSFTSQQINGSGRQLDCSVLTLGSLALLKSHPARRPERDTRHDAERRWVAVPPDARARRILRGERFSELLRFDISKSGRAFAVGSNSGGISRAGVSLYESNE